MAYHPDIDKTHRMEHFSALARRFALDAKMLRCRAAVHVENKSDIIFWGAVLKHFRPGDRFHFISSSRNEYGQDTSGVTQALKYYDVLNPGFIICIDSDYRYLQKEHGISAAHYVLQTYTYSFENHLCFSGGLDDVCEQVTHLPNTVFSFKFFLTTYSAIIYDLFIWHLYFLNSDPSRFTKYEFNKYINIASGKKKISLRNNAEMALDELRQRVEKRTGYFGRRFPHVDLKYVRQQYEKLGLIPSTAYLFVRGHNLYDMMSNICKDVCKMILKKEEIRFEKRGAIVALYKEHNHVDTQLHKNLKYGAYDAIRKIEADITALFNPDALN